MALAHNLGFPRTGRDGELKRALEAFGQGQMDEAALRGVGQRARAEHWQLQKEAGIELLPVGDFAWGDWVLNHSLAFGVIPEHLRVSSTLQALLALTQGQETAPWFDSGERYLVPEFTAEQAFELSWEQLFDEVAEAQALGHRVKPVLIGPLTYLWLGKAKGLAFDRLDLLERLLPVYGQILQRLAEQSVEWVQIDEPILALELPQDWKNGFERAYNILQRAPLKLMVASYFGGLEANLGLAANLPVDALHLDLVRAPEQFPTILDRLPAYKTLSLGLVDGSSFCGSDLDQALVLARQAHSRLGERLWLAPSSALRYCPAEVTPEGASNDVLDFAREKCTQVVALSRLLKAEPLGEIALAS